jgi:hypothetical protein
MFSGCFYIHFKKVKKDLFIFEFFHSLKIIWLLYQHFNISFVWIV